MNKKHVLILVLAALLLFFAGCTTSEEEEETYPGLSHLVELTNTLATHYNEIAETAINNGWEYDDETVEQMDEIATLIETINAGILAPETFAEGQISELTESAKTYSKELDSIKKKVAWEYVAPEEGATD